MFLFLIAAQTAPIPADTAKPVEAAKQTPPMLEHCPDKPTEVPPFGWSCEAKQQAADVSRKMPAEKAEPVKSEGKEPTTEKTKPTAI